MNNFFSVLAGQQIDGNFDSSTPDFEDIPKGTRLKVLIETCAWKVATDYDTKEDINLIEARWTVLDGDYTNRKLFQKLKVCSTDPKVHVKAMQMLAAIDCNCGGKLMAAGVMPDDMTLAMNLCNVPMVVEVGIWESKEKNPNGTPTAHGNFVSSIGSLASHTPPMTANNAIAQAAANVQKPQPQQAPAPVYAPQQQAALQMAPHLAPVYSPQQPAYTYDASQQPQNMTNQQLQDATLDF